MFAKEVHCNGHGKRPGDGFITYKRKRDRPSMPIVVQEDASPSINLERDVRLSVVVLDGSASACREVSDKPLRKKKYRDKDIGWDHGMHVEGNRYRWQCKWCGMVRSGGVSRLKQHLAGVKDVRKCPKVPRNIAETMKKHLTPSVLKAIDMINSRSPYAKVSKEPLDVVLPRIPYKKDGLDRVDSHWRSALEHMLQVPDVTGVGGIQSCIHNALISGPFVSTRKSNKAVDVAEDATKPKDRFEDHYEVQDQSQRLGSSETGTCGYADVKENSIKCRDALSKILCSEPFVLMCDLIFGSFKKKKASEILDFSLINTKMKNGDYEGSPGLFDQDVQQVWEKLREMGQEMIRLANNLSNNSVASSQKQAAEDLVHEADEQKFEETSQAGEQRNSMESNTRQFPSYESDRSTKPEMTEASCLYKICTCKQCGTDADGKHSLICDGCEAMFHLSCIEQAQQKIPTQSWYCSDCTLKKKKSPEPLTSIRATPDPVLTCSKGPSLHENCVVCDRLDVSEAQQPPEEVGNRSVMVLDSRESSVSSMESDEPPEPARTAMLRLCKKCGTCEDDDRRFLVCGHAHCRYVFYHIRCLRSNQTALPRGRSCWYCPSCLCRACLSDKDDDKIVLCDGCDEGYHTYCMRPARASVPEGQWYCLSCNVARAKEGMRRYEEFILEQHGKKDASRQANEVKRSMAMLLSAAEKLSSEEQVGVGRKDR